MELSKERKLELTLTSMLPHGLKTRDIEEGFNDVRDLRIETLKWSLENSKPLLHSLDKLTEPILEGGLIPIVELAKIGFNYLDFDYLAVEIDQSNGAFSVKATNELNKNILSLTLDSNDMSFIAIYNNSETKCVPNQLELFEELKKMHFNLYGLEKDQYIEKSTANV